MKQRVILLITGTLTLWILVGFPARWVWDESAQLQSLAAMALCLGPAVGLFCLGWWAIMRRPQTHAIVLLGGLGGQLAVVLGLAGLTYFLVPALKGTGFWIWLLVFFEFTLMLEMVLLLVKRPVAGRGDGTT